MADIVIHDGPRTAFWGCPIDKFQLLTATPRTAFMPLSQKCVFDGNQHSRSGLEKYATTAV